MLKAYASYFASYLLANLKNIEIIGRIILFGSIAKDEAEKESDVDIFIEVRKESKKINDEIENILGDFYKSREALIFKAKGIDNKINLIIGKLENWKDLRSSIESTGILLYGNFVALGRHEGRKYAIIFWDQIGKNRGAFLNKIYGFKAGGKYYKGIRELFNGVKLGKSSIMIPVEHKEEIFKLVKHYRVNARFVEVYAELREAREQEKQKTLF
jgi:predicted nucleotidyltransferase